MQEEVWKDIIGYEGVYQVSNLGNVKTLGQQVVYSDGRVYNYPEKILKLSNSRGYSSVHLYQNGVRSHGQPVHRLVATAFIPNPENKITVNHKDGNKKNNHIDNLEWASYKENNNHAINTGLHKGTPTSYKSKLAKLSKEERLDVLKNCVKGSKVYNIKYFAEKYKVSTTCVSSILKKGAVDYPARYSDG